jgi:hypothetical protein
MMERGIGLKRLPSFVSHPLFYCLCGCILCGHIMILLIRSYLRELFGYCSGSNSILNTTILTNMTTIKYPYPLFQYTTYHFQHMHTIYLFVIMIVLLLIQFIVSLFINHHDEFYYRRYLQFLKLEFDTRLGMHSPR